MALDEALLESTAAGRQLPTLRLYAWQPACLSLGYAQPASDVDFAALAAAGWDWVRRPTGGRAILHTDELTYSVTGPAAEARLEGSVLESYRRISAALLDALHRLRIPAEAHPQSIAPEGRDAKGPVCFEVPSNYEIVVDGKKLLGSAQARRSGGVLQHGSLPLQGDLRRITWALKFDTQAERQAAANRLLQRALTAEDILGKALDWSAAARAFADAFQAKLNIQLEPAELSQSELQRAAELAETKYRSAAWNSRV